MRGPEKVKERLLLTAVPCVRVSRAHLSAHMSRVGVSGAHLSAHVSLPRRRDPGRQVSASWRQGARGHSSSACANAVNFAP